MPVHDIPKRSRRPANRRWHSHFILWRTVRDHETGKRVRVIFEWVERRYSDGERRWLYRVER